MQLVFFLLFLVALALANGGVLQEKREFGFDDNLGDSFVDPNFGTGETRCNGPCKSSADCCNGYKCKRFRPGGMYGYCAKKCSPVRAMGDCQRCQECVKGYKCTIFLNQQHICFKRKK